mmetsp:Transcript_90302/g.132124  ORF Transcript_90302/g.132124 Transcript_90302/m.132124 type:complete len:320 (+) Transcript_90302:565-1524(+)
MTPGVSPSVSRSPTLPYVPPNLYFQPKRSLRFPSSRPLTPVPEAASTPGTPTLFCSESEQGEEGPGLEDIVENDGPLAPELLEMVIELSTELSIAKCASKSHDYHESANDYAILEHVNKMDIKSTGTTELSLSKVHAQDRAQCRSVPLSSRDSDKSQATAPPVFDDEDRISVITQTWTDEDAFGIERVRSCINSFLDHGVNKHLHTHDCTMLCLVSQDSGTTCLINAVIKEDWPCCHGLILKDASAMLDANHKDSILPLSTFSVPPILNCPPAITSGSFPLLFSLRPTPLLHIVDATFSHTQKPDMARLHFHRLSTAQL